MIMCVNRIDAFVRAYIAAALWSSTAYGTEEESDAVADGHGDSFDMSFESLNYDLSDLAPETLASMIADCDAFRESAGALLDEWSDEQAGHDFWLTRNGHGAGFWDRGLAAGDALTDLAHPFGEVYLYLGGDGKIYG
jgi:hypothetical protein